MKIDLSKIKLVVWDLDDTFWTGTLSEGGAMPIEANMQLVRDLTDCGIINSICSKNDTDSTKQHLLDIGIWDYFVFASINWDGKGQRLKQLTDQMALRPVNVLFLDDNPSNLGEAQHFMPDLQVAGPDEIPHLIEQVVVMERKDITHKRLKQYKVLETKAQEALTYGSNEDFLFSSNIQVTVHHDCVSQTERLHELLMRSNQLNYTKKRIPLPEFSAMLANPEYKCGYVSVVDRFGDYGIVGFYAMKDGQLEHFFFSCRTMGQMIEQWVYAQLGFPKLKVVGEVRTQLNTTDCPKWINQSITTDKSVQSASLHARILLKGPCDLSHSQVYIHNADCFDSELTYVRPDNGQVVDAYNHSAHIIGLHAYTQEQNQQIMDDCPFVDPKMLKSKFFSGNYDVIFLSTLVESVYPIYCKRGTDLKVVLGSHQEPLPTSFLGQYDYLGMTTSEMYTDFLERCLQWLPAQTILCLILGVTHGYDGDNIQKEAHRSINEAVKAFAATHSRVRYIDVDQMVHDSSDFEGGINHYSTRIYYEIAQAMIDIIETITGNRLQSFSRGWVKYDKIILYIRNKVKKIVTAESKIYHTLKFLYNWIYKTRK